MNADIRERMLTLGRVTQSADLEVQKQTSNRTSIRTPRSASHESAPQPAYHNPVRFVAGINWLFIATRESGSLRRALWSDFGSSGDDPGGQGDSISKIVQSIEDAIVNFWEQFVTGPQLPRLRTWAVKES